MRVRVRRRTNSVIADGHEHERTPADRSSLRSERIRMESRALLARAHAPPAVMLMKGTRVDLRRREPTRQRTITSSGLVPRHASPREEWSAIVRQCPRQSAITLLNAH